jgi:LemA protein
MTGLYIALGVVFVLGVYFIATYNVLVRLRQHCRESWSGIDTELKRRYNLIPNLVSTVKGYAAHERETLEAVVKARQAALASHGSPEDQAADENMLVDSLKQLMALAEGYPDLKANENFLHLQEELVNTENRIQDARRFYNANVRDLNTRVEVFPSCIIANMFHVEKEEFFEIEDSSMAAPIAVDMSH